MDNFELFVKIEKAIVKLYNEHELSCVRGFDDSYTLNGRPIHIWHSEVTRKCAFKYPKQFDYSKNLDDILFCSDELLYFTAHLYLYRPYINNPLDDRFHFADRMVYPNNQNLAAKRYSMYADIASQCAYNFWDRVGDLIASFFPDRIKTNQIYFGAALKAIPTEFHSSKNYLWLDIFKKTGYKDLNDNRKQIVHYTSSATAFNYQHLEITSDIEEILKLQSERETLPEFYKGHIDLTLIGFEKALLLLEEVSEILFNDIVLP